MNKRQLGTEYENVAAEYLQSQGYEIIERNFRCRSGEIDLIAREGESLCFVEVKYRAGSTCGSPMDAVGSRKQRQILKVAKYYLMKNDMTMDTPCRFDVVAVEGKKITLLRNAFGE